MLFSMSMRESSSPKLGVHPKLDMQPTSWAAPNTSAYVAGTLRLIISAIRRMTRSESEPARVAEVGGVVVAVGVGVPLLGVCQVHDGVDGDEPAQRGVVLAGRKMGQTALVFRGHNIDF